MLAGGNMFVTIWTGEVSRLVQSLDKASSGQCEYSNAGFFCERLRKPPQRGVKVRNSARADSLNSFSGSIPFPFLTSSYNSRTVLFGSK